MLSALGPFFETLTRRKVVRKKFRELLHNYRVESFKMTHDNEHLGENMSEILKFTDDALNNAYHYHFHENEITDGHSVETFNMIKNYTLESILPPVLEKVMRRVIVLEKQHESIVKLIDSLLEVLSEDQNLKQSSDVR